MKPERAFVAERMLAQHCPELLRANAAPVPLMPALSRLGEGIARALSLGLATLAAGDPPLVRAAPPRECTFAELGRGIAPLAANSLLAIETADSPLLASLDAEAVLRLVDRAFGGRGDAPSPLPSAFPLSSELMVARLEGIVAAAIGQALGKAGKILPLRRDGCVSQLDPFPTDEVLGVIVLEVDDPGRSPWQVTIAIPQTVLTRMFGEGERAAGPRKKPAFPPDRAEEPFASVPLTLSAVLVDMRIGFAALSNLQPGQILPVAVARSVPLKVGDTTIAHGTIGALDDRVAVQVTQAF
jgi:flagellar motor switch protein FliM